MDSLQYFILAILVLVALVGVHRRRTRAKLIQHLLDEGKSAAEIDKIMGAYHRGDEQ